MTGDGTELRLYYTVDGTQSSPKSISGTKKGTLSLDDDITNDAKPLPANFATNFAVSDPYNKTTKYKVTNVTVVAEDPDPTTYPQKNNSVILTIESEIPTGGSLPLKSSHLTVSYTDPTKNDDFYAIQDTLGNDAISFTGINVINI